MSFNCQLACFEVNASHCRRVKKQILAVLFCTYSMGKRSLSSFMLGTSKL